MKWTTYLLPVPDLDMNRQLEQEAQLRREMADRTEFSIQPFAGAGKDVAERSPLQSGQAMVSDAKMKWSDLFIICQTGHVFAEDYSRELLSKCIMDAQERGADLLSGCADRFQFPIQVSDNLFWVKIISGMRFVVIFDRFYEVISGALPEWTDQLEPVFSSLTDRQFIIYPYVSVHQPYLYSEGIGDSLEQLCLLNKVKSHYMGIKQGHYE